MMGICTNYVVGNFKNITDATMEIPVPNAEKIIFVIDNAVLDISINTNTDFMTYKSTDGVVEFACHDIDIYKIYVKSSIVGATGNIRVWAYI